MLKRVFRHDVVLLCCSTLISILAAIITLIYADRLKSQSAQIEYRLQQSEKADFELQQTIFRFDVFFATDRVLETQLSNEQVNSEIRTLVGETLFFDRQAPFLFMASAVARSPEAYATLRDSYLGFSAKARQRDVAAYRDLLGLEGRVVLAAQRLVQARHQQMQELEMTKSALEARRTDAFLVGFTLQQLGALCAMLAAVLPRILPPTDPKPSAT